MAAVTALSFFSSIVFAETPKVPDIKKIPKIQKGPVIPKEPEVPVEPKTLVTPVILTLKKLVKPPEQKTVKVPKVKVPQAVEVTDVKSNPKVAKIELPVKKVT